MWKPSKCIICMGKITAQFLLKLLINGYERWHTIDHLCACAVYNLTIQRNVYQKWLREVCNSSIDLANDKTYRIALERNFVMEHIL